MTDKYAELRAALNVEPISDDWIGASYGPKTVGVGISGGPALLMVRPSECIDHGEMRRFLHGFIMSRRHARALLAERDALIHDNAEYVGAANALATENERLRNACEKAIEWLEGWASAEPYLVELRAALTQQEQV